MNIIEYLKFRARVHLENAHRCDKCNAIKERNTCYAAAAEFEKQALLLQVAKGE